MKRILVLVALLVGCGGGDEDPITKCHALGDSACARVVDCRAPGASNRAALLADCRTGVMSSLDCGRAVAVDASYDRCMSEVASATCAAWTANPPLLPASCHGVIKLSR
jgi:hypothetical protein